MYSNIDVKIAQIAQCAVSHDLSDQTWNVRKNGELLRRFQLIIENDDGYIK